MPTVPAPVSAHPRGADLADAARDAGVIWLGMFVLGTGFGTLVTSHGFPWWLAPVISATVYAGSAEFILVGMVAAHASLAAVALTTFLINSRHLFYGLSFPLHRVRGRLRRAYSVVALTDEAYALTAGRDAQGLSSGRILWTQIGLQASWVTGSVTGAVVGATVLGGVEGVDFVLTALFIVLTMDAYRATPDRVTLAIAVACGLVALAAAPGSLLLVAMIGFTALLVARHRLQGTVHTGG